MEKLKTFIAKLAGDAKLARDLHHAMIDATSYMLWGRPFRPGPLALLDDRGDVIRIEPLGPLIEESEAAKVKNWTFDMTHPPSPTAVPPPPMTEKQVDEMIAYVIQAWPRGALARFYRLLHDAEGFRMDNVKMEERKWIGKL